MHRFHHIGALVLATVALIACGAVALASVTSSPSPTPTASASPSSSSSPTASPVPYPTFGNDSISIPNVPQSVIDRIPAVLTVAPASAATVSEATAEQTATSYATGSPGETSTLQLEGYVLATTQYSTEPVWIFVYHSTSEIEPVGCSSMGGCGGHYYFQGIGATTGQAALSLTGIAGGT